MDRTEGAPAPTTQTTRDAAAAVHAATAAWNGTRSAEVARIRADIDALTAGQAAIITWPEGSTIGVVRRAISGATFLDFGNGASLLVRYSSGDPVDGIRAVHGIDDVAPASLALVKS